MEVYNKIGKLFPECTEWGNFSQMAYLRILKNICPCSCLVPSMYCINIVFQIAIDWWLALCQNYTKKNKLVAYGFMPNYI